MKAVVGVRVVQLLENLELFQSRLVPVGDGRGSRRKPRLVGDERNSAKIGEVRYTKIVDVQRSSAEIGGLRLAFDEVRSETRSVD